MELRLLRDRLPINAPGGGWDHKIEEVIITTGKNYPSFSVDLREPPGQIVPLTGCEPEWEVASIDTDRDCEGETHTDRVRCHLDILKERYKEHRARLLTRVAKLKHAQTAEDLSEKELRLLAKSLDGEDCARLADWATLADDYGSKCVEADQLRIELEYAETRYRDYKAHAEAQVKVIQEGETQVHADLRKALDDQRDNFLAEVKRLSNKEVALGVEVADLHGERMLWQATRREKLEDSLRELRAEVAQ